MVFEAARVHEGSQVTCGIVEFMGIHPVRSDKPLSIPYGEPTPRENCLHLLSDDGAFVSLYPLLQFLK